MIKAGDIIGRAVVSRGGGQQVGKLKDVVVDATGTRVVAFEVDGGLLKGGRIFQWAALQAIGPDSLVIDSDASVVKASHLPEIKALMEKGPALRGLKLQTTEGKALGKVEDFVFDEATGQLGGYELSGGFWADTYAGRAFLPTPDAIELGKEVAFISPQAAQTIRQQEGGIKGAFRWPGKGEQETPEGAPVTDDAPVSDLGSGPAPAVEPGPADLGDLGATGDGEAGGPPHTGA